MFRFKKLLSIKLELTIPKIKSVQQYICDTLNNSDPVEKAANIQVFLLLKMISGFDKGAAFSFTWRHFR